MKIVDKSIKISELDNIAQNSFGKLVKAVIDIEKEIMAIGADMHADEEAELINLGSKQEDLWGTNLYPQNITEEFIEYDSIINIRPSQNNHTRGVENPETRARIVQVVEKLIIR